MRRVLIFIVVALVVGALYGYHVGSTGVSVNGQAVSARALNDEIAAVHNTPVLQCYLGALAQNGFQSGAGGATVSQAATSIWANMRIDGMTIASYVQNQLHYRPTAAELSSAQNAFESELTVLAAQYSLKCPGTAAQAVAAMPANLRRSEILDQADSLYLLKQLKSTVPLTPAEFAKYYRTHLSSYQSVCVSIALVPAAKVLTFVKEENAGVSVAALARKYSKDPSAKKGGAYGCYGPTNPSYAVVSGDVKGVALNHWTKPISYQNGAYGLFVAPTKRTTASFASVESSIVKTLQSSNGTSAQKVEQTLLYYARVVTDSALGTWVAASTGSGVAHPTLPPATDVSAASLLAATTSPTYK